MTPQDYILYFTPFYPPQSEAAATRSYWFIKRLREKKPVRVITSIATNDSNALVFNPADNKQSAIKRLVFEVLAGIELFLRILFSSPTLVVFSSPPFITVSIAHWAVRIKKIPYLIDVRDLYPEVFITNGLLKEDSFFCKLTYLHTHSLYKNSKAVMSVTPGLVEKIRKVSPRANVHLIPNGYDSEVFKKGTNKYSKFTVAFHGTMGKIQNISTILKVAERLKDEVDIEFLFIGDGPQAKMIQDSNLKNIRFLGPKSYKEIPQLISKAHIGFSARVDTEIGSDAYPVKIFEYLGVGIPSISTPATGVMSREISPWIFEFSNEDISKIAEKILVLKSSGDLNITAPDKFSRQETSKKILELCDLN